MRADRLLSMLLLLQTRGRMSASELAAALEVSTRTVYRDVQALSAAGVPIYAATGVQGGYALLESYRTSLTGMNEREVRALFMLSIPQPLADLGVHADLRAALLKLTAALPAAQQRDEVRVRQRIHLDATWWFQGGESIAHLPLAQQAVWQDRRLRIHYAVPGGPPVGVTQDVDPYGLVAKAGVWYLVYAGHGRFQARRISRLQQVEMLPESFTREPQFDLPAFWQCWCAAYEAERARYPVTVLVAPQNLAYLRRALGEAAPQSAPPIGDDGRVAITLYFEYLEEARAKLLALGGMVEVVAPRPLRLSLADFAAQIVSLYARD